MRTVNGLIEIITPNVTSWIMFLEGPILHSSELGIGRNANNSSA